MKKVSENATKMTYAYTRSTTTHLNTPAYSHHGNESSGKSQDGIEQVDPSFVENRRSAHGIINKVKNSNVLRSIVDDVSSKIRCKYSKFLIYRLLIGRKGKMHGTSNCAVYRRRILFGN